MILSRVLKITKLILRKLYTFLNQLDLKLSKENDQVLHNFLVKRTATKYDMNNTEDENYYAEVYGRFIEQNLTSFNSHKIDLVVDLACGSGRTIKDLLNRNMKTKIKEIIGVDFVEPVLKKAKENMKPFSDDKVKLSFVNSDMIEYLDKLNDHSVDVFILLEVVYMLPDAQKVYNLLKKKMKLNGIAILSVRPEYYYSLSLLGQGLIDDAYKKIKDGRGDLYGSGVQLNWTDSQSILKEFPAKFNLNVRKLTAVGTCSGIPGDPYHHICRPANLTQSDQIELQKLEEYLGNKYPDTGRYILFCVEHLN